MLLNLCKPLRNWTFQHFARAAQKKGRNGSNKQSVYLHSLGLEPRSSAYLVLMLYPLSYGCQWVELNFFPYKLSNHKFTPLPSLHVDSYSGRVVNSVFFFSVQLIPLHNTAALINIYRFFFINVAKFMQTPTKLDLPTLRNGSTEERTQLNK